MFKNVSCSIYLIFLSLAYGSNIHGITSNINYVFKKKKENPYISLLLLMHKLDLCLAGMESK